MPTNRKQFTTLSVAEVQALQQLRGLLAIVDKALVPVAAVKPHVAEMRASIAKDHTSKAPDTPKRPHVAPGRASVARIKAHPYRVVYRARDGRVVAPEGVSPRDAQVYRAIRASHGLTRAKLLTRLKADKHTGIVDGAVRRLRLKKLVVVEPAVAA